MATRLSAEQGAPELQSGQPDAQQPVITIKASARAAQVCCPVTILSNAITARSQQPPSSLTSLFVE